MKRPQMNGNADNGKHVAAVETEILHAYLPLVEHCCVTAYDDGSIRQPGWFTVRTVGRAWVLDVKDPDTCLSFRVLAETLDEVLESAALLLAGDAAPWEPDPWLRQRNGKKPK